MNPSDALRTAKDAMPEAVECELENIPPSDDPVLIVWDYRPNPEARTVSMAFDLALGPRCWVTVETMGQLEKSGPGSESVGPRRHDRYGKFELRDQTFYPYSIERLTEETHREVGAFQEVCRSLYRHAEVAW